MIERPGAEDRFSVRHQQRRRVPLIDLIRSRGHDHLTILLSRQVDHREVRLLFARNQGGQAEQGGEQGAHLGNAV